MNFAGFAGSSPLVLEGKICAESAEQNDGHGHCGKLAWSSTTTATSLVCSCVTHRVRYGSRIAAMAVTLPRIWKQGCVLLGICFLLYILLPFSDARSASGRLFRSSSASHFTSLHLDKRTCERAFPRLTNDIDDMVSLGPFKVKQARNLGPLQVKIQDNQASLPSGIGCARMLNWLLINISSILFIKKMTTSSPVGPCR